MLWTHGTRRWSRIGSLCHLLREPQGFPAHRLSLHCLRACAVETRSAHSRSLLQDRRAWSHLRCAASALRSHHWLLTCSCVACCLARALACGIEPSRPLAKHFRSHSRTRRFNSARTSVWIKRARRAWLHRTSSEFVMPDHRLCFAASPSGLLRHNRPSTSVRAVVCSHLATFKSSTSSSQCRLISSAAFSSTASNVLHARSRCSPCGPACSRHTAAPPAPRTTFLHTNRSRPELAQWGHCHVLHAAAMHVIALHVVALHSYSPFSCCRTRTCSGLAAPQRHPCTPVPRASLTCATPAAATLLLLAHCHAAPVAPPAPAPRCCSTAD
jgi:hypothetical protein